jgi:hypothetical protein
MKRIRVNTIKALFASCLAAAGLSAAHAQGVPSTDTVAQVESHSWINAKNPDHGDTRTRAADNGDFPSGFNTGPTQYNVKGCVGPISYCNIFFGS